MILQVVSDIGTSRTYRWDPPSGVEWYIAFADGERVTNAPPIDKNGNVVKTMKFFKGTEPHEVVAIIRRANVMSVDVGIYPPGTPANSEDYNEEVYGAGAYSK